MQEEGRTLGSGAVVVAMDGRGALGKGFSLGREILSLCVQLSVSGEKAMRRILSHFFCNSFEN